MKGMLAMPLVATVARAGEGIPVEVLEAPWTAVDGETILLEEFRGRQPVYLKFWASWCSTCREEMPHLQSVYRDHGDEIAVIAVNLGINDDREAVLETRDEFGLDMPIVIDRDGMLAQAFDLVATPYHVLLDRDLRVVHAEYAASDKVDETIRRTMLRHDIRQFPLLIVIYNGREILRIQDFGNADEVAARFRQAMAGHTSFEDLAPR